MSKSIIGRIINDLVYSDILSRVIRDPNEAVADTANSTEKGDHSEKSETKQNMFDAKTCCFVFHHKIVVHHAIKGSQRKADRIVAGTPPLPALW